MRYFATASTERVRDAMRADLLGQIITPAAGNRPLAGVDLIADNGIYSRAYPGDGPYLDWLEDRASSRARFRFAVAPDVVADHEATMERSAPMFRPIREVANGVAVCAQNGATPTNLPWGDIDAVFLAGIVECVRCNWWPRVEDLPQTQCPDGHELVEWKIGPGAAAVAAEARRRRVWCHMGRVNSWRRLIKAKFMGCDSADGTFLAFGPDRNLPQLLGWLDDVNQPDLFDWFNAA